MPTPSTRYSGIVTCLDLAIGRLDLTQGELALTDGALRALTPQECALLAYLAAHPHQDVSRGTLLTEVMGYAATATSRAVDDAMKRLRAKVERVPSRPFHLLGVRGVGYRFVPLETAQTRRFRAGERTVDLDRLVVEATDGSSLSLSAHEAHLLSVLLRHQGRPVRTPDLLREVWGVRDLSQRRVVDKLVYRLRAKLEDDPRSPRHLRTVRGRGLALHPTDDLRAPQANEGGVPCPPPDGPVLGRAALVERVLEALQQPRATVTLHGPAGAGKSTLARAVAQQWTGHARLADLMEASEARTVHTLLARAVGVDASPEDPLPQLRAALEQGDDVLVVVDHAEVALDAVAHALTIARRPESAVRLLTASRHPVGLPDEQIVEVGALDEAAAIDVFVARATAADVPLDREDPRVARVVSEVDRLPLAIDLAAGRLRLLGLDGLLQRLDRPLEVLRDARTHDGLATSLARSWDLLSPPERRLLQACCALPGALSASAAERVCVEVHDGPVLDGLQRLVDFALLKRDGTGRLVPYIGVRDFVAGQADVDAPLQNRLRQAHVRWLAEQAEGAAPYWGPPPERIPVLAPEVAATMAMLKQPGEAHDKAAILLWLAPVLALQGQGQLAHALLGRVPDEDTLPPLLRARLDLARLRHAPGVESIERFGQRARSLAEHARAAGDVDLESFAVGEHLRFGADNQGLPLLVEWEERARRLIGQLPSPMPEAHLRCGLGWAAFRAGELDTAWFELQEALTLARLADAPWLQARIRYNLAGVCRFEGRLSEAEAFLEQSRACYDLARVPYDRSDPDDMLGLIRLEQGRFDEALALHQRILGRTRRTGQRHAAAMQANRLGTLRGHLGELSEATKWFQHALRGFVETTDRARAEGARFNLGLLAMQAGRTEEAEEAFAKAREAFDEMGRPVHAGVCLGGLARTALARGEIPQAERWAREGLQQLDAARALRQAAELRGVLAEAISHRDASAAVKLAREAVAQLQELGATPTLGIGLCRLGWVAADDDDDGTAREALKRARQISDQMGTRAAGELGDWIERLARRLDDSPGKTNP